MERESFEDEGVAALLNERFVSIKVDREERPDVDHIYMSVCQAMTGQGGWPLTIAMTPDSKPFFAGTYFPKETKWGRTGLIDILKQLSAVWTHQRDRIDSRVQHIVDTITPHLSRTAEGTLGKETLDEAFSLFSREFDSQYGGFGDAPKFPTPHNLLMLLRYWKLTGESKAFEMVEKTLVSMHLGGIYDHVGMGFARYSVDRQWLVPHFEKMLYDNALLSYTYLEAYQATGDERYASVARDIFTYVLRDMTDPGGGFYSAEDADSEGEEGKFYVWTPEEVVSVLGEELGQLYCHVYDITSSGNFEGHSIPNLIHRPWEKLAAELNQDQDQIRVRLEEARKKLFAAREQRVHPGKDDKILTAWNGLMIAALAKGAQVLEESSYLEAAQKSAAFIQKHLRREDGRLLARYRDGHAAYPGYVDDYAFLIWGLLEVYEASFEKAYLELAQLLQTDMDRFFWDDEDGGYFFYGSDAEQLFARPKEIYDGATPSGNGVAAYNMLRLFHLTGKTEYQEKAETLLRAFAGNFEHYPAGYSFSLLALQWLTGPAQEIVIVGEKDSAQTKEYLALLSKTYLPFTTVIVNEPADTLGDMAPIIADKTMKNDQVTVYVCRDFACQAPITNIKELKQILLAE